MQITLTGATGFIGRRLVARLLEDGHALHLLGRTAPEDSRLAFSAWDTLSGQKPPENALSQADAVIHLAGTPVAQRWTAEARRNIRASRVEGTAGLVEALAALPRRPGVLVCGSAIGIYGSRGDEILTESSAPGRGFLAEVCTAWEEAAARAEFLGIRVVRLRIGVVLGRDGGALARMLPAFKMGAGGRLGSGRQWMSWIHVDDVVSLLRFVLAGDVRGPVNATAPNPVQNAALTRELGMVVRRPTFAPVPGFLLKLTLGETSTVLLDSQRVLPRAAEAAGFRFLYPELGPALRNLLA